MELFQKGGILFAPAKASNAGGVATSGLEMSQNSLRYSWSFDEVDEKLRGIMLGIFHNAYDAAKEFGAEGNLVVGANIAGFLKVADAMRPRESPINFAGYTRAPEQIRGPFSVYSLQRCRSWRFAGEGKNSRREL